MDSLCVLSVVPTLSEEAALLLLSTVWGLGCSKLPSALGAALLGLHKWHLVENLKTPSQISEVGSLCPMP